MVTEAKSGKLTEELSKLLFALASEDRLTLLSKISVGRERLTTLSRIINASAQECSRHLARLSESGFIRKGSDGFYETTSLGKTILRLFPSIQFLLKHRNYFLSHDLSLLPQSFTERIGELVDGKLVGHFNVVLEHIKKVIMEAREHVWLISDQPVVPTASIGNAFTSRSIPVRLILEHGYDLKDFSSAKSLLPERFEIATMTGVGVAMAINEKLAGVLFPGPDGKLDFGFGFVGSDPLFRAWCSDLFDYYWTGSAEKVRF